MDYQLFFGTETRTNGVEMDSDATFTGSLAEMYAFLKEKTAVFANFEDPIQAKENALNWVKVCMLDPSVVYTICQLGYWDDEIIEAWGDDGIKGVICIDEVEE